MTQSRSIKFVLKDVTIRKMSKFLKATKFELIGPWGPYQQRFQRSERGNIVDVILPTTDDIDDYEKRIYEALATISTALNKDVSAIISAIRYLGFEKFDIRARPDTKIATIPYQEGAQILHHGAELVRHAAIRAYTNEFRPQNRGRRPAMVDRYMERLEIGQTSVGSYIFSLLLPNDETALGWGGSANGSDDHAVSTVLTRGIELASQADRQRKAPTRKLIEETGLSVEFYDHLHEIIDWADDVSFAISEPINDLRDKQIVGRFKRESLVPIKRTIEKILPPDPPKIQKIVGTITNLNEPNIRRPGSISLKVRVEGRQRSIRVQFPYSDRDLIIEAFRLKSKKFLEVSGYIKIESNGHLVMERTKNFKIVDRGPLF